MPTAHGPRQCVLIPSSSGLLFEWTWCVSTARWDGLNPFFIRSAVRIWPVPTICPSGRRLNPFFIRSAVRIHHRRRARGRGVGLNPFFIRSAVRIRPADPEQHDVRLNPFFIRSAVRIRPRSAARRGGPGLNPFFIRSAVRIYAYTYHSYRVAVLIPSSSGLLFESIPADVIDQHHRVLIPSSSGLLFECTRRMGTWTPLRS